MALSYNHSQPPNQRNILPDEENTVHYIDDRREEFEIDVPVSDLMDQPPYWGMNAITSVVLAGTMLDEFEYDVVDGHRDPATIEGTYSYEEVTVEFWSGDNLVLRQELDDLTENDVTWGRLFSDEEVERAAPASRPFLNWLVSNRELAGQLPLEIR